MENLKSKRLLLVEDDEISQFLLQKMISMLNIEVTVVSNGVEALEILQKEKFDIILMDIEMPVFTGYETTQKIRASGIEFSRTIPIIGISANPFEQDADMYLQKGMNDYITKPIQEKDLEEKINRFLS